MQAKLITTLCRVAGTNNFSPRHDLKKNSPSCFTAGIKELYKKHPGLSLQKLQFFLEKSISLPFILKLDKNILLVLIKSCIDTVTIVQNLGYFHGTPKAFPSNQLRF